MGRREPGRHRPGHRAAGDPRRRPGEPSQTFHHDALGADATRALVPARARRRRGVLRGRDRDEPRSRRDLRRSDRGARDLRELGFDVGVVQDDRRHARRPACATTATTPIATRASARASRVVQTHEIFSTWPCMAARAGSTARLIGRVRPRAQPVRPRRQRRADDARSGSPDDPRAGGVLDARSRCSCSPRLCGGASSDLGSARLVQSRARSSGPARFPTPTGGPPIAGLSRRRTPTIVDRPAPRARCTARARSATRAARSSASRATTARGSCRAGRPTSRRPAQADAVDARSALATTSRPGRSRCCVAGDRCRRPDRRARVVAAHRRGRRRRRPTASSWSTLAVGPTADLDLHVVDPTRRRGVERQSEHVARRRRPAAPIDPDASTDARGGILDHDAQRELHDERRADRARDLDAARELGQRSTASRSRGHVHRARRRALAVQGRERGVVRRGRIANGVADRPRRAAWRRPTTSLRARTATAPASPR